MTEKKNFYDIIIELESFSKSKDGLSIKFK